MNLKGAWNKVKKLGYNPFYLGLYGSQNYGIDTEKSDFDYKCIIIPSLKDLVHQTKPVSKSIYFEGGLIDIKDIRLYTESAVKVNVNFIEILSTEYFLGNTEIRKFYSKLVSEMPFQYIRACYGMMQEKKFAMCKNYPSKEYEIKTFGYDPKQLCHIVRLSLLIDRANAGNFDVKHIGAEKEELLKIKSGFYKLEEANSIAEFIMSKTVEKVSEISKIDDIYDSKREMVNFSRQIIMDFIKESFLGKQSSEV